MKKRRKGEGGGCGYCVAHAQTAFAQTQSANAIFCGQGIAVAMPLLKYEKQTINLDLLLAYGRFGDGGR